MPAPGTRTFPVLAGWLLLMLTSACASGSSGGRGPVHPARDLEFALAFGGPEHESRRTEVWLEASEEEGHFSLRVRRSAGGRTWPRLWGSSFETRLSAEQARTLSEEIELRAFFDLPPLLSDEGRPVDEDLWLRIRHRGRRHAVRLHGRNDESVQSLLNRLDRLLPVDLSPWPTWLDPVRGRKGARPGLPEELERSLQMHHRWIRQRRDLHALELDRFALLLALDRQEEAAGVLEGFEGRPGLSGLLPELRRLLR